MDAAGGGSCIFRDERKLNTVTLKVLRTISKCEALHTKVAVALLKTNLMGANLLTSMVFAVIYRKNQCFVGYKYET